MKTDATYLNSPWSFTLKTLAGKNFFENNSFVILRMDGLLIVSCLKVFIPLKFLTM